MATLTITADRLHLHLTTAEKVAALHGAGDDELLVSTPAAGDVARSLRRGSGALA